MLRRILTIEKRIAKLYEELRDIQKKCKHPANTLRYKLCGSTGGWDYNSDSYWTDYYCGTCNKIWSEEGQKCQPPEATRVGKNESIYGTERMPL